MFWENYFISLGLGFLISNMGINEIYLFHVDVTNIKWVKEYKACPQWPTSEGPLVNASCPADINCYELWLVLQQKLSFWMSTYLSSYLEVECWEVEASATQRPPKWEHPVFPSSCPLAAMEAAGWTRRYNGVGSGRQFWIRFKIEYLLDLGKIPLISLYLSLFSLEIKNLPCAKGILWDLV